jgi:AraC-like DNA-binding protein
MFDGFLYRRHRSVLAETGSIVDAWVMRADSCRMAVERVLPDASIEIYINLGAEGRHEYGGTTSERLSHRASWVVGPRSAPLLVEKEVQDSHVIGVRIPSTESERLLGVPASELRGSMIDLDQFWRSDASTIRDRVGECDDAVSRLRLVVDHIHAKASAASSGECAAARHAYHALRLARTSSISEIARSCDMTHRAFIALLERSSGLKPKELQRVLRLRAVLAHIHAAPRPSWTHIAADCGYYDQAHLINDFRQMSGMSPGEYETTRSSVGVGVAPYLLARDCKRAPALRD